MKVMRIFPTTDAAFVNRDYAKCRIPFFSKFTVFIRVTQTIHQTKIITCPINNFYYLVRFFLLVSRFFPCTKLLFFKKFKSFPRYIIDCFSTIRIHYIFSLSGVYKILKYTQRSLANIKLTHLMENKGQKHTRFYGIVIVSIYLFPFLCHLLSILMACGIYYRYILGTYSEWLFSQHLHILYGRVVINNLP